MNYADVRRKVEHAFAERAFELHNTLGVVQSLSKATLQILQKLDTHCGSALWEAQAALSHAMGSSAEVLFRFA